MAATHCFVKDLMNTVIQDNINPIEKVERSSLIMASTVHGAAPQQLINEEQVERVATYSPMLIEQKAGQSSPAITASVSATALLSPKK
jgi:hypothetical protein